MNGTITAAHALQQARYQARIAESGILAALAPYRRTVTLPAQRSVDAARPAAH